MSSSFGADDDDYREGISTDRTARFSLIFSLIIVEKGSNFSAESTETMARTVSSSDSTRSRSS